MLLVAITAVAGAVSVLLARAWLARHGSGRLAQVRFRRLHGVRVARLLEGEVDPRPHSPWIAIRVDERPARMVAAPLDGALQAGIELFERSIPVNVWHTRSGDDELEVPDGIDRAEVRSVATQLGELGVDSLAAAAPIAHAVDMPHVLRIRFASIEELPGLLGRVAPLLEQLESLGQSRP